MDNALTHFLAIFRQFAADAEVPSLDFNSDDACQIRFGDGLIVYLQLRPDDSELVTYTIVGSLANLHDRAAILEHMLKANAFWTATNGFTLSVAEDDQTVVLADSRPLDYFDDADFLHDYLTACADSTRDWQQLLNAETLPPEDTPMTPDSRPPADDSPDDIKGNSFRLGTNIGNLWA